MTGIDLGNVHVRPTDAAKTWTEVGADSFNTCMNGVTEAEAALAERSE